MKVLVNQFSIPICHHDCTQELLWVDLVMSTIFMGWLPDEIWFAHFFYEDDFYFVELVLNQFSLEPTLEIRTLLLFLSSFWCVYPNWLLFYKRGTLLRSMTLVEIHFLSIFYLSVYACIFCRDSRNSSSEFSIHK